jgi:hypothetical protein
VLCRLKDMAFTYYKLSNQTDVFIQLLFWEKYSNIAFYWKMYAWNRLLFSEICEERTNIKVEFTVHY